MRKMKKCLAVLLVLCLCLTLCACENSQVTIDNMTYRLENGEATLLRFRGGANEVTVPDSVNDCPVTAVAEGAFLSAGALRSVSLPGSLQIVGAYAFSKCDALVNVTYRGENLRQIGKGAFASCGTLEYMTLPQGLETLGEEAFADCPMLVRVTLPGTLKAIGDRAFARCPALCDMQLPPAIEAMGEHVFLQPGAYLRLVVFEDTLGQRYAEEYGLSALLED